MALIVQKFGGSSGGSPRRACMNVARIVAQTHAGGNDVVVVVSAQGDTTDELIAKAGEITHDAVAARDGYAAEPRASRLAWRF